MADATAEGRTLADGLGAIPLPGASTVCETCKHPKALHGNGSTPCRAFACHAGPSVTCGTCGGTRLLAGSSCETCGGTGSVPLPCQRFAVAQPAALAS